MTVVGTGGGATGTTSSSNVGVIVTSAGLIAAGSNGTVSVAGFGGSNSSGSNNQGVFVRDAGSAITSSGGNVTVEGTGGGAAGTTSASNYGVFVFFGGLVSAGGIGTVDVTGTGGAGGGSTNFGVYVTSAGSKITSSGGDVTVEGIGGGAAGTTSAFNFGVYVASGGVVSAGGSGSVDVTGTGGSSTTGASNYGVLVNGFQTVGVDTFVATITSSGGKVTVEGTGGGSSATTSSFNVGVRVENKGLLTAGSNGDVSVTGTGGGGGGSSNYGVYVVTAGSAITSSGGGVTVEGTGGGAAGTTSASNIGVYIVSGGLLAAGGSGDVSVTGIGGSQSTGTFNRGVYISSSGSAIVSLGGSVSVTGIGGTTASSEAVAVLGGGLLISGLTADLTITADSMAFDSSSLIRAGDTGAGKATLQTRTAGTLINLGGADIRTGSPLTLGLTDAELDRVTAGTLVIGNADSGTMTISAQINRPAPTAMQFLTGGNILINSGPIFTSPTPGGSLELAPGASGAVIPNFFGSPFGPPIFALPLSFATDATLRITINGTSPGVTYSQLLSGGSLNLTGAKLDLTGSFVATPTTKITIVNRQDPIGLFGPTVGTFQGLPEGAELTFNGRTYTISYVGGDGNDVVLTAIYKITNFDVQQGQTQRSFVRYVDTTFESASGLTDLVAAGGVRLTRYPLSGAGPGTNIDLSGQIAVVGDSIKIDFGTQGIGGNRNSNTGNGYYVLEFDADGNGSFETSRTFYRLFGDVNGDKIVNTTDASLIMAAVGKPYNVERDVNGDGFVNINDRTFALQNNGQALGAGLPISD